MEAALSNFAHMHVPLDKALILGDMLELGHDSGTEHQKIADMAKTNGFGNVFLVGENFSQVESGYPRFRTLVDFTNYIKGHPITNKYILIKGSRGIQLEKCVDLL
jgi:UDP-N-acetylmuramoyl-tripeptide--D-alanyl-D-alanine ligase